MMLQDRLLASLFVGFSHAEPVPDKVFSFLGTLGRILTPAIYNCVTHARFARGDRRRDALVDLTNVINTSLELHTVLSLARQVIANLEEHCASAINLLEEGGRTFKAYRQYRSGDDGSLLVPEPEVLPVKNSVMSWLLTNRKTYESEDLSLGNRFADESFLAEKGVRRFVAVPMFARGRIHGAFVFGSRDPRPRRRVEYWLYENIALQLALAIDNAVKHEKLKQASDRLAEQNTYLREEIHAEQGFGEMIGLTPAMERLREDIARVAPTEATVLISGETGVGKELVAREIHSRSSRSDQTMVKINCPGIPEGMVESELFGHERGAFTSAVERRIGRFELANNGTLFLDEIGELTLSVQAKLLRVLQDGEFERVGGSKTLPTNARIIAVTNRDLAKAIEAGTFRADLFYRLNVFPIVVPPLKERREDIPLLIDAFISHFCRRMGKQIKSIDPGCKDRLCQLPWRGNIRELRHAVERAVILCDGPVLHIESVASGAAVAPQRAQPPTPTELQTLEDVEAGHIRRALKASRGVIEGQLGAAKVLGLKPSTLRFRMKRLGIERNESSGD